MTTVKLSRSDVHNQQTVRQCHPLACINRKGGQYDLVVLGGGSAGLVSAMTAAAQGYRVSMTEQRLTGGTWVNFRSTPSKALIRCARAVHDARRGSEFGFNLDRPGPTKSICVHARRRSSSEGVAKVAIPVPVAQFERLMRPLLTDYRRISVNADTSSESTSQTAPTAALWTARLRLLDVAEIQPKTAALLIAPNRLGARPPRTVLGSMYQHLAQRPPDLSLAWLLLAPLDHDGWLTAAISQAHQAALMRADQVLVRLSGSAMQPPSPSPAAAISTAVEPFVGDVITTMPLICALLRRVTS